MAELSDSTLLASFGAHNNRIVCDTGETLTVIAIARVLPNARLVCKCLFNNIQVYVKIFIGLRANIHAAREVAGIILLQNANILTPNLLLETTVNSQPLLVFAAITNAQNAEVFMQQADFLTRKSMAENLAKTVANLHQANLVQTDIHLKNFLIEGDDDENTNIYTIDGDGIQQTTNRQKKQRNLSTFLSKFDALDDDFMQESTEAYFAATAAKFNINNFFNIYLLTQKIRRKIASDYADKKVFRNCSDVKVLDSSQHILFISNKFNIQNQQLEDLDSFLVNAEINLKNGNTCTIGLAKISQQLVVIKRYNLKSICHKLALKVKQSRAKKSWANAHRLQLLNIATPQPLALLLGRGFNQCDYFLSTYIDAPDVAEYFAKTHNKTDRAEAVKNIVTLFYKLLLLQISHGDMKASNIKMVDNKPVLIDLDSMRQHSYGYFAQKAHVRDLKRFMQNWLKQPALYNAFVKTFKVIYDDTTVLQQAGIDQNKEISHKEISE